MPTDRNLIKKEIATYAKALLEAAQGSDSVFAVEAQLAKALDVVRSHMKLKETLADSTLDGSVRSAIVQEVFADFDPALKAVLGLIAERGDMGLLSRISEEYTLAAEEATDTVVVDTTTVVALTDELREIIKKKLSADFKGKNIVLREHVDPSILGGIIMSAHGNRVDASIASQLENARRVLSTVPNGGER